MSAIWHCCKGRKSDHAENVAKEDFLTPLPLQGSAAPMRSSVVVSAKVAVAFDKLKWDQPATATTASTTSAPANSPAPTSAPDSTTRTTTGAATTTTTTTTISASKHWYPDHAVYNATKDELKAMPEFKY
jgi:hypothetical protein